jgi:Collagen triple helix repeat (20 copies)
MAKHQKKTVAAGPRGPQGARGATGRRGAIGKTGHQGVKGPKGSPPLDLNEVAARLDRIQTLADELAKSPRDILDQMDLSKRIYNEIQAAKLALNLAP